MTEIHCGCGASRLEEIMCADCMEYYRMRWIPVSERLPEAFVPVLLYCADGYSDVSMRTESDTGDIVFAYSDVTHWMPLPEPPMEAE